MRDVATTGLATAELDGAGFMVYSCRQAEVHQLALVRRVHQDVIELQVPVNHVVSFQVLQAGDDVAGKAEQGCEGQHIYVDAPPVLLQRLAPELEQHELGVQRSTSWSATFVRRHNALHLAGKNVHDLHTRTATSPCTMSRQREPAKAGSPAVCARAPTTHRRWYCVAELSPVRRDVAMPGDGGHCLELGRVQVAHSGVCGGAKVKHHLQRVLLVRLWVTSLGALHTHHHAHLANTQDLEPVRGRPRRQHNTHM